MARHLLAWAASFAAMLLGGHAMAAVAPFPRPLTAERVEAYADGAFRTAMEQNHVAGATIAIVLNGEVLLSKGYGVARITPQRLATNADTLFQVASISKTPVYIAAMQLVEAGKIKLDDPANLHLPPVARIPDQGFKRPVLVRHLMTHSSGFEDSALGHLFVDKPERLMPMTSYAARFRVNRVMEAGLQTSYSNYALVLLGVIVEHVSGKPFPAYMEERVLRPLGMARATYRDPYPLELVARLKLPRPMDPAVAANSTQQLGGPPSKLEELGPEYTSMIAAAGGMRASANDMAQYLLALSDPARMERLGVLKASTFATMLQPGIALPGTRRLGFMHYDLDGGRTGFGHGGAMAFGASDMIVVPDLGLGVFVSTNGRGGFAFANDLVRRLLRDVAPLPALQLVRNGAVKAMARSLEGEWIANRRAWTSSERAFLLFDAAVTVDAKDNGDLIVSDLKGETNRMVPLGNGVWQSANRMTQRIYAKDAEGRMTSWSGTGTGSSLRAGLLDRPRLIAAILIATLVFGTAALAKGVRRYVASTPTMSADGRGPFPIVAASALWVLGLGGFFTMLLGAIPDRGAKLIFSYPGPLPVFAWTIALAVGVTLIALVRARGDLRLPGWSLWRKAKHAALLLLFALATIACWRIGLLGYSGF